MAESGGQPDYYSRYNPDLLKLIPPDAGRILEIGCGAGVLAEMYRRVNPGVEWIGVEVNTEAANQARPPQRCSRVVNDPIETFLAEMWSDPRHRSYQGDVDCVILGDILEHLEDPWYVVAQLAEWFVKPGGQVIASIPNVQHWSVIKMLLSGEWEYQDEGLMDRTHLRWFTLKSAVRMFKDAGLHVFGVQARIVGDGEGHSHFIEDINPQLTTAFNRLFYGSRDEAWESTYEEDSRKWSEFVSSTRAYQYLVRAVKPEAEDAGPPSVLIRYLIGCHACGHVRCSEPGAFLATIPGVRVETHPAQLPDEVKALGELDWRPGGYDHKIVVLERVPFPTRVVAMLEDAGWTVILELDDVPGGNFDNLPLFVHDDCLVMRNCHAIQTTTDVMKATIERMVPGQSVRVIPNQIAELRPFSEEKFEPGDRKVRVFFGAIAREKDWAPLMPELNRLARERDDVEWVVVNDPAFFNALETEHKALFPYLAYPDYRAMLRSCDVALLPLEDTEFNRHKSDLKFLECAAEGVVAVCSETVYSPVAYSYIDARLSFLRALITGKADRRGIARDAYAYVRENRLLSRHYRAIYDWYLDVSRRRQSGELRIVSGPAAAADPPSGPPG